MENLVINKLTHSHKHKYLIFSHMRNLSRERKHESRRGTNRDKKERVGRQKSGNVFKIQLMQV